jgi:hypothetical protein
VINVAQRVYTWCQVRIRGRRPAARVVGTGAVGAGLRMPGGLLMA